MPRSKRGPNAHIWEGHGLTPKGMEEADEVMPFLMTLVGRFHPEVLRVAMKEAIFQGYDLALRDERFQKRFTWRPKKPSRTKR